MVEGVFSVRAPLQQEVCCCSARTWALFIGWFQITTSVIGFILMILVYTGLFLLFPKKDAGSSNPVSGNTAAFTSVAIIQIVILTGLGLFLFVGGIVLVIGVSQGSASKLQCWLIIEGIFFALEILNFILELTEKSLAYGEVVATFISIVISLFCMWVVNLHRKELMRRDVGRIGIPM